MKKKLLVLILPMIMLCLLTGCVPEGIVVHCSDLPKQTSIHFLAQMTPEEAAASTKLGRNKLNDYSTDGWYLADSEFYDTGIERLRKSAQKYKSIKIAVTDHDGEILRVSPEFEITIKDRNYFWKDIKYSYKSNTITGKKTEVISRKWNMIYVILLLGNFWCFIMMIIFTCAMDEKNYKSYILSAIILNAHNIGIVICVAVIRFNSYYKPLDSTFADGVRAISLVFLFIIFMNFFGAMKFIRLKKSAASQELKE